MFSAILGYISLSYWTIVLVSIVTFLLPVIFQTFSYKKQDLKKKYSANWALVTGGSSGIGRGLCEHLAAMKLNIVMVALDDDLLTNLHTRLSEQYPSQEFRKVGVDLGKYEDAFQQIVAATEDIDVQIVFNNAGYLTFGLFTDLPLARHMNNYHVNTTISVMVAHHFAQKMVQKKLKGCIAFTSSPAGQMPGPMAAIYGGTKAFLTNFGTSLACELKSDGIDVIVMHPSPVDTNFYSNDSVKGSSSLAFFKRTASPPTAIAEDIIANIGRRFTVIRNQGYFAIGLQFLVKIIDFSFLSILMRDTIALNGEFRKMRSTRK